MRVSLLLYSVSQQAKRMLKMNEISLTKDMGARSRLIFSTSFVYLQPQVTHSIPIFMTASALLTLADGVRHCTGQFMNC